MTNITVVKLNTTEVDTLLDVLTMMSSPEIKFKCNLIKEDYYQIYTDYVCTNGIWLDGIIDELMFILPEAEFIPCIGGKYYNW